MAVLAINLAGFTQVVVIQQRNCNIVRIDETYGWLTEHDAINIKHEFEQKLYVCLYVREKRGNPSKNRQVVF